MNIKKFNTVGIACVMLFTMQGCSQHRLASGADRMTIEPAPYTVAPDSTGNADIDIRLHIPHNYFSSRSRLFVVPTLVAADTVVKAYRPLVLDAPIYSKKMRRRAVLNGEADPYADIAQTLPTTARDYSADYKGSLRVPAAIDSARLVAVASADGCGRCTGIDTVEIGTIVRPKTVKRLNLTWQVAQFEVRPKVRQGGGVAHLQFAINRYDINLDMGNNRAELAHMLKDIAPILNDSLATLNSLSIYGMASADGPLGFNTQLARNRANAARQWLDSQLLSGERMAGIAHIGSRPEGWQPVLDAMIKAGDADSTALKAILTKYASANDDVQERYIRRLPAWQRIRDRYLDKDRKVEYAYSYTIRSFTTDKEMLAMYATRPDAFNEDELLHVAALATDDATREQVYRTTLKYFPQSAIATNNLAIILERNGKTAEAEALAKRLKELRQQKQREINIIERYEDANSVKNDLNTFSR